MIHPAYGLDPFKTEVLRYHRPIVPGITQANYEIISALPGETEKPKMSRMDDVKIP